MKRTFLARRNALLSPGGFSAGLIAVAFAVSVVALRFLLPDAFLAATTPFARMGTTISSYVDTLTSGFQSTAALSETNETLMRENAALTIENRALSEKVADLTALLGSGGPAVQGIVAGVLTRPPFSPYDTYVLSAGAGDGVSEGMGAFGPGGIPLGIVSTVTTHFSRLTLYSAAGMLVPGWIGRDRLPVTLRGEGGGTFSVEIPRSASVSAGDIVYMSAPGAVPIGTVAKMGGELSDPSLELAIQPILNPLSITWVLLREGGPSFYFSTSTSP